MPRDAERRRQRPAPPKLPNTLSLPTIPAQPAERGAPSSSQISRPRIAPSQPVSRPRSVPQSQPRVRRAPELLPTPDDWEDAYSYDDQDYKYDLDTAGEATQRQSLITVTPQNPMRASGRQRAVGPVVTPPLRLGPPPRPLRRTLLWQMILALSAVLVLALTVRSATPPASAYASAFQAQSASLVNQRVVDRVPIQTQIDPTIGYDSPQQYKEYSNASCGAASASSVLLAWGDPKGRIGQVIDDMIPYLQPIGMVDPVHGFAQLAQRHGFKVVITNNITAAQIAEIVTVQGIPVIVGIRDTNGGYYSYFSPGHFLVIVGADPNGFRVVDNSTYFVHYFPTATFLSLWDRPRAVIYYPPSYNFQMP